MCGICGIVEPACQRPIRPEILHLMANSIAHRGPDAEGFHFESGAALGHRRLSIIDLSSGQQPLSNEDGTVWIVFNGEIYNYRELRTLLEGRGHQFRTRSDTETIVHLYEDEGAGCFARLRGMFALAIWDRKRRTILLARDRIGKKPLFYSYDGGRVIFGSEMKALLAAGEVQRTLDNAALADYFTFLYIPSPKTIYRSVRKVRPGHYIEISPRGMHEQQYWDLSFSAVEQHSESDWAERIVAALLDATSIRLMSEVPLGSFLSGGIDSSAVVAAMAQTMHGPLKTSTVAFDEEEYNEAIAAREMAEFVGADHHECSVHPSAIDIVHKLAWHYDEPFADSSAVPTYYVSHATRRHVTVALSGDGGDESFAGYRRYKQFMIGNARRARIPEFVRRHVLRPFTRWYPGEFAPQIFRGAKTLESLAYDPLDAYLALISVPDSIRSQLFSNDLRAVLADYDPLEQFREHYRRADTSDPLSRIQYLDVKTYLTDDICVKVDRASMAVSLEVRCPLLDHKLLELAARIPSCLKLRGSEEKYIFKRAIAPMLPASLLTRSKHGFGVPIAEWFRGELRDWAHNALFEHKDSLLNEPYVRKLWRRHQSGLQDNSQILWAVTMFRCWQMEIGRI